MFSPIWSHFTVEEEHDSCERFQPEFFLSKLMVFNHYLHHIFLIWEQIISEILEEFVMSHDTNTIKKNWENNFMLGTYIV
jgi:hypothetical protein